MSVFKKIFTWSKKQAYIEIINKYNLKWFLIINYIYFANLVLNWIIWNKKINSEYQTSLLDWDFLLPDWIALNIYFKKLYKKNLQNLNWTDFLEYFLSNINKEKINLILYWTKKEIIKKAVKYIENKFNIKPFYYQNWFSDFDFWVLEKLPINKINIFLLWLWTPKQEIWIKNNLENIKKYNLMIFSQWGTFDFWAWIDKRAPKIFQKLKLEWLFRVITNPKKNFKKVLYSFYLFIYLFKK